MTRSSTFDLARIAAESFVRHVEWRAETVSTNDLALELAGEPTLPLPALVLTDRQTSGRGRGTNRWWSAEGALTFSLIIEPDAWRLSTERWPQISIATAVAICDALLAIEPKLAVGVKWPNDVHVAHRKIAGILVEAPNVPSVAARRIVLGIGLNVNNSWRAAPENLQQIGAALCDLTGQSHDPTNVLLVLLDQLAAVLGQLSRVEPALSERWQSLCVLRGRTVEIEQAGRTVRGICQGIGPDGALLLDTPSGPQRLFGGTVTQT